MTGLKRGAPRRSAAQVLARHLVSVRSGGRCEICRIRPAVDWQHRKNRSQGGDWSASNGLDVCRGCHTVIHLQPQTAYANGWSVRQAIDPKAMPAWLWTSHGRCYVWLHDDGSLHPVDMPDVVGSLQAETIYERGLA
jgi:hypothetical protein